MTDQQSSSGRPKLSHDLSARRPSLISFLTQIFSARTGHRAAPVEADVTNWRPDETTVFRTLCHLLEIYAGIFPMPPVRELH